MPDGFWLFVGWWVVLVAMVLLGIGVGRWLRSRDDVVRLARRDRRRARDD